MAFNIKYVYNLVDKISPQLNKVKANIKKVDNAAKRSSASMKVSFDKMRASLNKFGSKIRDVGKSLFLKMTVPIGLMGASFIKAASDAEETSSKFATVFSDIGKEAESTANTLAKNFGLSAIKSKELLGDTGDLLTGFGFTGKAALDLAEKTNKLAVDLASFTNFSGGAEGASKALTKALLGERESVKSLGISILEEDVKTKVATLSAQGMRFESERQAKAIATLQIALDQSKNAIGDYSRTNTAFANRMRVLNARFHDFRILLGNIILPLALKMVNITIKWIEKFNELSPTVKKIILIVGGLAAVLSPLLIAIGFMIPALTGLAAAFGLISLPALAVTAAIASLIFIVKKGYEFVDKFSEKIGALIKNLKFLKNNFGSVFDTAKESIRGFFGADIAGEQKLKDNLKLIETVNKLKSGSTDINQSVNTNINRRQDVNVGGQLGININGLPKGSNTNFTPMPDNQMNVGVNTVFAGG